MAQMLQIITAAVLVALCVCLVPLLLQLKRTAVALERLADSAREDLGGIARDVHEVRRRLDGLADLAAAGMALPVSLGESLARLFQCLPDALERRTSGWLGLVIAGLKLVLGAFLRPKEPTHE